jgi:hypothetical protein
VVSRKPDARSGAGFLPGVRGRFSGKVKASEPAERFNLRGGLSGGIGAKSSRSERRGVHGTGDASERKRVMALRGIGGGYEFPEDYVAADSVKSQASPACLELFDSLLQVSLVLQAELRMLLCLPFMALFPKQPKKADVPVAPPEISVKYPKPKVLVLDLDEPVSRALIEKGFNVSTGTLGTPYKIGMADGFQPVIGKACLPNHTEQEVIVVDLHVENFGDGPSGEKLRPDGEPDLWAKCDHGVIDPRPRSAAYVRESFNRTLLSGGVFVVFADAKTGIKLIIARRTAGDYGRLYDERSYNQDEWHFLDEISDIEVINDHGTEMRAVGNNPLGKLVAKYLEGGSFYCTLRGGYRRDDPWVTLAENKFGQPVGIFRCLGTEGTVIVLPQISDKGGFLKELFTSVLPEMAPHLFPYLEKGKWTHLPEYELAGIAEFREAQTEIKRVADADIATIETQIQEERNRNGWLHDLLTGTDAVLVEAVKKAFESVGFSKILDIDVDRDREGKSRREDLQIRDQSPTLVVDIKGIGGYPSDEDALQADKHAAIRMREETRTDIVGLSIINHQRHLPPLERENAMPFRKELIDAAQERTLGLMTAWDVYRLVRNFRKLGWAPANVIPLFYRSGRIEVVPQHYQFIGTIAKVWTGKFGVVIEEDELRIGDRLAIEFPIEFEEIEIGEMQVSDQKVTKAKQGDPVGLLWPSGRAKLREKMRVFRVSGAA